MNRVVRKVTLWFFMPIWVGFVYRPFAYPLPAHPLARSHPHFLQIRPPHHLLLLITFFFLLLITLEVILFFILKSILLYVQGSHPLHICIDLFHISGFYLTIVCSQAGFSSSWSSCNFPFQCNKSPVEDGTQCTMEDGRISWFVALLFWKNTVLAIWIVFFLVSFHQDRMAVLVSGRLKVNIVNQRQVVRFITVSVRILGRVRWWWKSTSE